MLVYFIIIFAVIIVAAIGGTIWFMLRARRTVKTEEVNQETTKLESLPFRWNYIMLPLIVLFISIALSAYFYPRLPDEVAIQLSFDEPSGRWLSLEMTTALTIAPQALLTLLGAGLILIMTKFGILSKQTWNSPIKPERILWFMGNLTAIPEGALCFTMFSIFYYNVYQVPMMSTWLFLLITLGVSGALLGIFLVFIFFKMRQQPAPQSQETAGNKDDGR